MVVLLVLLTFTVCILINLALQKRAERRICAAAAAAASGAFAPAAAAAEGAGGIFFHGGHTWARLDLTCKARVGIDEFALGILGRLDRIELPSPGKSALQGRPLFAAVRGGKRVEFVSPLDGIVRGVNEALNGDLAAARKDPYNAGWVVALEPSNLAGNLKTLTPAHEAVSWLEREATAFKEFFTLHVPSLREAGATLPDGGHLVDGVLDHLEGEALKQFERKFLR